MKATLDCLECIASQTLRAARVATDDPELQRRILNEVVALIPAMDVGQSPAVLSLAVYETAARLTGKTDPYRELKRAQNAAAKAIEPELRALIAESADPLVTALHLSAAGNIIDLGVRHADAIDVRAAVTQVLHERFAVEHLDEFRASLETCRDMLFFLDNAGEIVFDCLLIEELMRHTRVTAVVKAGPIINDVTIDDAREVGLTDLCEVVDNGGAFVGTPLDLIPASFRQRMDRADMLVAKGQGNYETLDEYPGDVYLILRAKCEIIAQHMGVQYGQVGLISTLARARLSQQQ